MSKLSEMIKEAIEHDGFLFIGVLGDKGLGKSVLALNLLYQILGDWNSVLRHVIFTINDFGNLYTRTDLVRHADGRIKAIVWDDFALYTSSYGFTKRGEREQLIDFVEDFEVVREDVAVLIVTCATWEMIPPKLRDNAHVFINMVKRGVGEVWVKQRSWLFLKRDYKKIGEMVSEKIPDEVYNQYREFKRKAKRVKEKYSVIKQKEKAQRLAEELTEEEIRDIELMTAYGVYDLYGNITDFGKMFFKYRGDLKGIERGESLGGNRVLCIRERAEGQVREVKLRKMRVGSSGRVVLPTEVREKYKIELEDYFIWLDYGSFVIGVPDACFEEYLNFFFEEKKEEVRAG